MNTDTRYPALNPPRITVTLDGTSESDPVELAGLSRGALTLALCDLESAGGTVVLSLYTDEAKTTCLFRETLDFSTTKYDSVAFPQPVPYTAAPWWTVTPDATSDTKAFGFALKAVATH